MKYFICNFGKINLGIPAPNTLQIVSVSRIQTEIYLKEGDQTFISLPALFRQKNIDTPHGIVLKSEGKVKTMLLSPKVEIDLEIPEEGINELPEILSDVFMFLRGVYFNGDNGILVLDTEKLTGKFL